MVSNTGTRMGVWLDHERAVIVGLVTYGTTVERINSDVGKRVRLAGGSRSRTKYGPQDVADERARDARYQQSLRRYYDRVARLLKSADEIYICGPGEARIEFRKILEKSPDLRSRIRSVEPADKMTDRQFAAHVREIFEQPRPRARRSAQST